MVLEAARTLGKEPVCLKISILGRETSCHLEHLEALMDGRISLKSLASGLEFSDLSSGVLISALLASLENNFPWSGSGLEEKQDYESEEHDAPNGFYQWIETLIKQHALSQEWRDMIGELTESVPRTDISRVNLLSSVLVGLISDYSGADKLMRCRWKLRSSFTSGHLEMISNLIEKGADPIATSSTTSSVLWTAMCKDDVDVVEHIMDMCKLSKEELESSFGFEDGHGTTLEACVRLGCVQTLRLLLDRGYCQLPRDENPKFSILHYAVCESSPQLVFLLIERKANVLSTADIDGIVPFTRALIQGHLDTARILLPSEYKSDILRNISRRGFTCFGTVLSAVLTNHRGFISFEVFEYLRD